MGFHTEDGSPKFFLFNSLPKEELKVPCRRTSQTGSARSIVDKIDCGGNLILSQSKISREFMQCFETVLTWKIRSDCTVSNTNLGNVWFVDDSGERVKDVDNGGGGHHLRIDQISKKTHLNQNKHTTNNNLATCIIILLPQKTTVQQQNAGSGLGTRLGLTNFLAFSKCLRSNAPFRSSTNMSINCTHKHVNDR